MRFKTATVIAALPFLITAAPPDLTPKNAVKIPLSKRSGSNLVDKDGVVDVAAIKAHLANTIAKIDRGYAHYKNNTGVPHPNTKDLQKRSASGGVALINYYPLITDYWEGVIQVGTPPVSYSVYFDLMSSDLILPGPHCDTGCAGHHVYDPKLSSTSVNWGKSFVLTYREAISVVVDQYADTVQLAGIIAIEQTLGVAIEYSHELSIIQFHPDGVLGLGFQEISAYGVSPVFQTLTSQGKVDLSIFSVSLASTGSRLWIGGTDPNVHTGDLTYVPVTKRGFWQVDMVVSVSKEDKNYVSNTVSAVINIGTPFIIGDAATVDALYKAIGGKDGSSIVGAGIYVFPCTTVPRISLILGGKPFPISDRAFNLGKTAADPTLCIGGIFPDVGSTWVIGDSFLFGHYAVFDYGTPSVGFAVLA